ncbi:VOC family protein [Ensifer aridi]
MATSVRPFLMFEGDAEAAVNFYVSLFSDSDADPLILRNRRPPQAL